jgi:ABC-type glycerol-3-phosphate transport system substrate-binding protein
MLSACDVGGGAEDAGVGVGMQDWILRLHPAVEQRVGPAYAAAHSVPVPQLVGSSASRLAQDAREGRSDWDVYVGVTPFLELRGLVEDEVVAPWDEYVPAKVLEDLHPALRREGTVDSKVYAWPFLLDVVVQGWNVELVQRAGLDPGRPPATWDEYVENARALQQTGAAPYGCTFDPRPWRSLVPVTYTFDTDVYTEEGLFDYEHDAVENALEVLRRMFELAHPDVLDPSTTAGSGATTDEGAFGSQLVGYYLKYANALVRAANTWPDPSRLALSSPPTEGEQSGTVFWTTGIVLPRHAKRKRAAAGYAEALTYNRLLWRDSIGTGRQSSGQLPCYRSLWVEWDAERPAWVPAWAVNTFRELDRGVPIRPHPLGARQFTIAQPYVERYLNGEVGSARRVLRDALAAVRKQA